MPAGFWSFLRGALGLTQGAAGLDVIYDGTVIVGGSDMTEYWVGAATITQNEAGETGTMHISFQARGSGLEGILHPWNDIVFAVDGRAYFGGYIVRVATLISHDQPDGWSNYEIQAEGYETLLNRTPMIRRVYSSASPGDILRDMLNYALDPEGKNQSVLEAVTYVTAANWATVQTFVVDGDTLTEAIDRLALLSGAVWWIDANRYVRFGPASADPAPFSIAALADADYETSYPPMSQPEHTQDGSDIRNRITVYGGTRTGRATETFATDDLATRFQLAHFPVLDIETMTIDSGLISWGTYFYHSFDDYDALVDWSAGGIHFNEPVGAGKELLVTYFYGEPVTVAVDGGTEPGSSYATYGRWFDFEIIDRTITSQALAQAIAEAVLAEFQWAATTGSLATTHLGIKPGQELTINLPAIGLSGVYPVRRVTTEFRRNLVMCDISFGGRRQVLSLALEGSTQAGALARSTTAAGRHAMTLESVGWRYAEIG